MDDPLARIRVLGHEVIAYLRPGCDCDVPALARDVNEACASCTSIDELPATMKSVADRHGLDVEYEPSQPVPTDAVERLVSFGFIPRNY
jgi:hypothetical protein